MTIATYAQLQTAVADFLNREDLAAVVPTFIALAEAQIARDVRDWRMEKRSEAVLDAQYSALPSDFLQPIRLQLLDSVSGEISPISTSTMLQLRGERADMAGRPEHYAITAQGLELYPTPGTAYTSSLVYYARVPALSNGNQTNWLLTAAPDVYLYGSLIHSAPYLKDDPRIDVWANLYASAVSAVNSSSGAAKYGGTGLRMKVRTLK